MESFTSTDLKKMTKDEIIGRFMQLQEDSKCIVTDLKNQVNSLLESINVVVKRLDMAESSIVVCKKVNDNLSSKIDNLERDLHRLEQYSRRECFEFVGIPSSVRQDDLQDKVIGVLEMAGVACSSDDIEACHRIKKNRTIVKFSSRRMSSKVLQVKKTLKDKNFSNLGFSENTAIFINESLCPYYRGLWNKCKTLKENNKIHSFWTSNGTIRFKKRENDIPTSVYHDVELEELVNE